MLVPLQVVAAIGAPLEAAENDGALLQVDVVPTQIASFGNAQAMAEDQEADQPIAMTMPVALQGDKQLIHLGLGQMLARPKDPTANAQSYDRRNGSLCSVY